MISGPGSWDIHMPWTWNLRLFLACLAFFHASELCLAAIYMKEELGWSSLLLSKAYILAMSAAVLEHLSWAWFAPGLHQLVAISGLGLLCIVAGEGIRKTGMVTAGRAFTHQIRRTRHPDHQLVKHGIYRYIRHPGYLGWGMWAVGTQLLLVNPICTVMFAITVWKFFKSRIEYEEWLLQRFFGSEYSEYKAATRTWMPFIS